VRTQSLTRWLLWPCPAANPDRIVYNGDYFVNGPQAGSLMFDALVLRV
jgi:hypothetical protein